MEQRSRSLSVNRGTAIKFARGRGHCQLVMEQRFWFWSAGGRASESWSSGLVAGVVSESWNGSPVSSCSWPLLLDHGTAMLVSSLLVDVISES